MTPALNFMGKLRNSNIDITKFINARLPLDKFRRNEFTTLRKTRELNPCIVDIIDLHNWR